MARRKRWFIYGGVVCTILAAQLLLLLAITSPYPDVREPPIEAYRVVHPTGFSIVKPGHTRAIIRSASPVGDDQITILPAGGRSRYTPALSVRRLREPPERSHLERDGLRPGTFQGQEAFFYSGPSGEYDAYRVMTNRGGMWYEIALSIPRGDSSTELIPSPEWQRYLETFAPSATTQPSG